MNKTQKFIGLLAILPLALVTLGPDFIDDADAVNVGSQDVIGRPGYQPDKVCGDRLCSVSNGANVGSQDVIGRQGYQPDKVCGDRLCSDSASASSEKSEQNQSKSTISAEFDALSAQFAEKTQELRIANANGNSDKVAELQDELKDLRNQMLEWKNN